MRSIKILSTYKILDITDIETTATFIKAKGDDFSRTKFIIVNGHITSDFAISGDTLFIYPPEGIDTSDIKYIVVVAESGTIDSKSLLKLGFGYTVREASGVDRLVQLFVFVLLTTPGSYIMDKSTGGGLLAVMRKSGGAQAQVVLPELVSSIRKTESDIKALQAGLDLPASELLLAVNIIDTSINPGDFSVTAFVELVTLNGSRRAFNLGI